MVMEARGVRRNFASGEGMLRVLRGVDLRVRPAEIVAVVGPSGSGKSTLLHALGGLDRPDEGEVRLDGQSLWDMAEPDLAAIRNRRIGFVFQFHHLLPDFSARENVSLPCRIAGMRAGEAASRASELLEAVGLSDRADHRPAELSGGEQQRVSMARALANHPTIVLADEPSGNLDVSTRRELHALVDQLRADHGQAFVVATHDAELAQHADRVLKMESGTLHEVAQDQLHAGAPAGEAL
ncbi:MAG: ABC transporter ATP-binding protein [Gemmatimonadota bacterium]|jgi:lipoprotein-releasing system ATP-binding protein|nr:ABC transporter ATP-binding protein [Gemmatimonadota bacterium]MDP7032441.1 ABC transporter ATP-binding protein [Gemmatimonadota bacterium]